MNNEEILKCAPKGATHVEIFTQISQQPYFYRRELKSWCGRFVYDWWDKGNNQWLNSSMPTGDIRSLNDIRRIVELENPQCLQEFVCVEQMKEMTMLEIHRANQSLHEQLAKANEHLKELKELNLELAVNVEACCELTEMDMGAAIDRLLEIDNTEARELVNKFAIEQKIDGIERLCCKLKREIYFDKDVHDCAVDLIEQLRKGGES